MCPGKGAIAILFSDEYVSTASTGEGGGTKGGCTIKISSSVNVSTSIYGYASGLVLTSTTTRFLCPSKCAVAILFSYEYFPIAGTGEGGSAKRNCTTAGSVTVEISSGVNVAAIIYSYATASIVTSTTTCFSCPGKGAIAVLFGYECVLTTRTSEGGGAKGGCTSEKPSSVDVAATIYSYAIGRFSTSTAR